MAHRRPPILFSVMILAALLMGAACSDDASSPPVGATSGVDAGGGRPGGDAAGGFPASGGVLTTGGAGGWGAPGGAAPETGGAPGGGAPSGGAPSGGAPGGGAPSGGAPSGGAPSGGAPSGGAPTAGNCDGVPTAPGGYCVVGNQIFAANGGAAIIFRGVNLGFLHDHINGHHHAHVNEWKEARRWGSNIIRIPVDQTWWLADQDGVYRSNLERYISWTNDNGMVAIVDVHRSGGGNDEGKATAETLSFWKAFAPLHKDNGQLIFEVYNEPRGISDEELWRGGNGVAGVQQLYDAIRDAGAKQIVLIGGNDWGYDLRGWKTYPLDAGHYNVAFSAHPYSYPGKDTVSEFEKDFAFLASSYPFILTEFGYAPKTDVSTHIAYERMVLDFAEENGLGWTAWAWTDYFKNHSFFERQSAYDPQNGVFEPLTDHGLLIKEYLEKSK